AFKHLDEAARIEPKSLLIPATRAEILGAAGRKDEAMALLKDMVDREKSSDAVYQRAQVLARMNELDLAERDFIQLSESQADGKGYELLGKFYFDNNRLDQAIAALKKGASAHPSNEDLQRELMRALMQRARGDDWTRADAIRATLEDARRKAN